MKRLLLLAFLLVGCSPQPASPAAFMPEVSPFVVTAAPDYKATADAASALEREVTVTAQVAGTATAAEMDRELRSANATETQRAWDVLQPTLTAGPAYATETVIARQTATKQAAPAIWATQTHIESQMAQDEKKAQVNLLLEPWKQGLILAAKYMGLLLVGWLIFAAINQLVSAAADRLRGADVITAMALPEPQIRGLLPSPKDQNMIPTSARSGKLLELRRRSDGLLLLGARDLLLLAWSLIERGIPFSENALGKAIPYFREVQDEFLARGWARWKVIGNDGAPAQRQGVELTESGRAYLEGEILGGERVPLPPSPAEGSPAWEPEPHARTLPHELGAEGEGAA